jgi:hypothetical protein
VRATKPFMAASAAQGNDLPEGMIERKALEADPSRKLVTTFHMLIGPDVAAERVTGITHEIMRARTVSVH